MDLSIVPEHKFCVLRGLGQRPNKHETGGVRVNGIRLFLQSGYRFALLAAFLPPRSYPRIFPLPILQSEQGVLASFQEIIAKIACVQRKDTAYFLRLIQLVFMLYDCRNIIALCALKTNITQNMGKPHCAATLILILL